MPNILVVDEEKSIRRLIRIHLERVGYSVHEVADGAIAWEALQKRSYDLVICDLIMPGMDGFTLLEKMRGHEPTNNTPVILMGWMVPNEIGEEAFYRRWYRARQEAGKIDPTYALIKPFSPTVLVHQVNRILTGDRDSDNFGGEICL